jgi:hypothetical protein
MCSSVLLNTAFFSTAYAWTTPGLQHSETKHGEWNKEDEVCFMRMTFTSDTMLTAYPQVSLRRDNRGARGERGREIRTPSTHHLQAVEVLSSGLFGTMA